MVESTAAWFNDGGPFMWGILAVLAVALAVTLERLVFYFVICKKSYTPLVESIARLIGENRTADAMKLVQKGSSPAIVLLKTALKRFETGLSNEEIRDGVEEAAIKQVPRLSERLNYLSLFANISTLLGLLGTIAGLQLSFSSLATVEAAKKASMLADGISQAMITTAFGLIVAIPCMVLYTMLVNKQNRLVKDLDESSVRLLNFLKNKKS
ncbi:MAG: MotA/TolQ/ExbB proton channel family protein [Chitinispirillaceae bacterium]|nr:MotA/TolQ/ExbB proton channel family protein [Chitinispirillaceae bacterium]